MIYGNDLLFRLVSKQVPSALESLTSVFGMRTGGSSQLSPPEWRDVFGGLVFRGVRTRLRTTSACASAAALLLRAPWRLLPPRLLHLENRIQFAAKRALA